MQVTYKFDESNEDDRIERKHWEAHTDMYLALTDIDTYLRELGKGWSDDDKEKIMEKLQDFIIDSRIGDLM